MALCLILDSEVVSDLLTIREKGVLIRVLKPRCQLIKSTVAQLLQANDTPAERDNWCYLDCGVLCFVKSESTQSYFFHLYCLKREELLWEQELLMLSKYTAPRPYFHTLLGGDAPIGLNFANEMEAEELYLAVTTAHEEITKKGRREEIPCANTNEYPTPNVFQREEPQVNLNVKKQPMVDVPATPPATPLESSTNEFDDMDPMQRVLMQVGLREDDLKDKEVTEAVDLIINRYGGVKAVQKELRRSSSYSQTFPRASGLAGFKSQLERVLPSMPNTAYFTMPHQGSSFKHIFQQRRTEDRHTTNGDGNEEH